MNLNRYCRLLLVIVALLGVVQLGWAQTAASPPDKTLAGKAILAQELTGKPVPVVPIATIAAKPMARPTLWLGRPLTARPARATTGEPTFCYMSGPGYYVFCPKGLQTAYGVNQIIGANGGAGLTIAIVDAFAYPNAEANLAQFNADMGLPPCTTANGCFVNINLSSYDGTGSGWDIESMVDLEYAHAMAPKAKLVYIQAYDNYTTNLGAAVQLGAALADVVSNSWSGGEYPGFDFYWNNITPSLFASGDWQSFPNQGGASYPCSSPYATCIGGTSLYVNSNFQRIAEYGWADSGGGCADSEPMPAWQGNNGSNICFPLRAAPDVSAIADPNNGVAVYIENAAFGSGYWLIGGTSLATPVVAGLIVDVDNARLSFGKAKLTTATLNPGLYSTAKGNFNYFYFDVISGNNGFPAGFQFDLVTGLGVPTMKNLANRFFGIP